MSWRCGIGHLTKKRYATIRGEDNAFGSLDHNSQGWDFSSVAWEVRQNAEREADWYLSSRGQCASWISPQWLEQQRRTLPAHVFARLHESRWVEGAGAYLTLAEVDAIFAGDVPQTSGPVAIGVDLGVSRDRSVIATARRDREAGLVAVEYLETWARVGNQVVDLQEVEASVAALARKLEAPVILDPWQGVLLAQRLRARGLRVEEYGFTGDGRRKLFGVLLDLVRTNRLRARSHEEFRRELLGLEVAETAAGWRIDHKPGRHDDHVVAVGLAVQHVATQVSLGPNSGPVGGMTQVSKWNTGAGHGRPPQVMRGTRGVAVIGGPPRDTREEET